MQSEEGTKRYPELDRLLKELISVAYEQGLLETAEKLADASLVAFHESRSGDSNG